MSHFRVAAFVAACALAGPVLPQTGERGSTPPGVSQDGSRPMDGAIKGGAILPGESGGMPGKLRCQELTGTLKEDCLKQEREAGTGGSAPDARPTLPAPAVTTPPQNPTPSKP